MPKEKKKGKSGRGNAHSKRDANVLASEEESNADNASVISNVSDSRFGSEDGTFDPEPEENTVFDDFEDKLKEAIDGATQKSSKGRLICLDSMRKALTSRYLCDFILERKITICDVLERCLKRGKGEEQGSAAFLSALICTQLGGDDESESIFNELHPYLLAILSDPSSSPHTRGKCASSLGICCFIAGSGVEVMVSAMESLYAIFSSSFLKGNGVAPSHTPEVSALHSSALLAWSLLLTLLPPNEILDLGHTHIKRLTELLESSDLELRIAAGETIAVLHELVREYNDDFSRGTVDELCDKLRKLATDGQKFRAKKDRRQQRSSFRDILRAFEEKEAPDIRVKFGREILYINSWCKKRQYDAFCNLLGSGMNLHLTENELVRDIFELGPPLATEGHVIPKVSKFERHIANVAACKARTKSRNKLRDKRADVMR